MDDSASAASGLTGVPSPSEETSTSAFSPTSTVETSTSPASPASPVETAQGRKRRNRPAEWAQNKRKCLRNSGAAYLSAKKKAVS